MRDDVVVGSLRVPAENLQRLMRYLESQPRLEARDVAYCHGKVKETIRGLKQVQRMLEDRPQGAEAPFKTFWH
ncbi:MAG TPA: hypothetical protein VGB20_00935 [bacterium]